MMYYCKLSIKIIIFFVFDGILCTHLSAFTRGQTSSNFDRVKQLAQTNKAVYDAIVLEALRRRLNINVRPDITQTVSRPVTVDLSTFFNQPPNSLTNQPTNSQTLQQANTVTSSPLNRGFSRNRAFTSSPFQQTNTFSANPRTQQDFSNNRPFRRTSLRNTNAVTINPLTQQSVFGNRDFTRSPFSQRNTASPQSQRDFTRSRTFGGAPTQQMNTFTISPPPQQDFSRNRPFTRSLFDLANTVTPNPQNQPSFSGNQPLIGSPQQLISKLPGSNTQRNQGTGDSTSQVNSVSKLANKFGGYVKLEKNGFVFETAEGVQFKLPSKSGKLEIKPNGNIIEFNYMTTQRTTTTTEEEEIEI